jgi:outer membrane receptor protein involved in Fe transport
MNRRHDLLARVSAVSLAVTLSLAGHAAHAQGAADGASVVEELVVTAQKREERLQDVPLAVSVLSGSQLERQGIQNLEDVAHALPGISFSGAQTGRSSYSIRGISTNTEVPTVGIYIDDVPISARLNEISGAAEPEILDLERVEVLKGPQGTLYGGSAMGGAIKFITHQPGLETFQGKVGAALATTHKGAASYELNGVVNIPLVHDLVGLRLAGVYRDDGGYVDRVPHGQVVNFNKAAVDPATGKAIGLGPDGRPAAVDPTSGYAISVPADTFTSANTVADDDVNYARRLALRASVLVQPDDTLTITPSAFYQRNKNGDFGFFWNNLPRFQQSSNTPQKGDDELQLYSLTIKKSLNAVDLTSITAHMKRDQQFSEDYTFFVASRVPALSKLTTDTSDVSKYKYFTQELRASSNGAARLKWTAGAFYQREETTFALTLFTRGMSALGIPPLNGVPDVSYASHIAKTLDQYAGFADATYQITGKWDVSIGGRLFKIDQSIDRIAQGVLAGGTVTFKSSASEDGFTPKVSTSYKITPENMVYGTVSQGFRAGGLNSGVPSSVCAGDLARLGLSASPTSFQSDTLWNYELGSKNRFADGRLTVNAAAFHIDWSQIQQQIVLPTCGFSFTANVGKARSDGGEVEVTALATERLTLAAALSYTDAKITDAVFGTGARDGDPVLATPKWILRLSADYRRPLNDDATLFARADYQYRSSQWRNFDRFICRVTPGAVADPTRVACPKANEIPVANVAHVQDGYSSTNASIGVELARWTAQFYVNNIFDEAPVLDYRNILSTSQNTTLRPRTIGVRLDGRF